MLKKNKKSRLLWLKLVLNLCFFLILNKTILAAAYVVPGGQSIGVKMRSEGLMVVGYHRLDTDKGHVSPVVNSIKVGDTLIKIDDKPLKSIQEFLLAVNKAGKEQASLKITFIRNQAVYEVVVQPVYNLVDHAHQLGLYLRNTAMGIGTLTFIDNEHEIFGALGHDVKDVSTNKTLTVGEGQIVRSNINEIEKSKIGDPGEKKGLFVEEGKTVGSITKNTPFGIFGSIRSNCFDQDEQQPLPIGSTKDVKVGPAIIRTVVEGNKVEEFDIEIVETSPAKKMTSKGLTIKVTDPILLKKTGGIVQGMSGSPIIQNGHLIGAVTHVLVNDPTQGFGAYIECMLKEAGLWEQHQ
ncbi:MAG: SpoIVB peptidase [Bacillota bacterium]|jgi:stage IV sporulation protein B